MQNFCLDNAYINLARDGGFNSTSTTRVLVASSGSGSRALIVSDQNFSRWAENQVNEITDAEP